MKKIILTLVIFAFSLSIVSAQENAAKRALAEGDYQAAIKLYKVVIATSNDETQSASIYNEIKNAQKCDELLIQANKAYKKKKYSEAKKLYQSILKYNPSDKFSKKRVSLCSNNTSQLNNETFTVNGVKFKMIAVKGGTFNMGAQSTDPSGTNYDGDAWSNNEKPVHSVTLSDYYIGETEVTQELWEAVMGSNPSEFSGNPQRPVERVTWLDCKEFITKLNKLTGKNFRLPTEAEWEYAARGGNKSKGYKYSGSNTIGDVAWYDDNSGTWYDGNRGTHNVKTKSPNELGIYDMSGNVWEWCKDWYGDYSSGSQTNPAGPSTGSGRVQRGGSWNSYRCRVSERSCSTSNTMSNFYGFRLALSQ